MAPVAVTCREVKLGISERAVVGASAAKAAEVAGRDGYCGMQQNCDPWFWVVEAIDGRS